MKYFLFLFVLFTIIACEPTDPLDPNTPTTETCNTTATVSNFEGVRPLTACFLNKENSEFKWRTPYNSLSTYNRINIDFTFDYDDTDDLLDLTSLSVSIKTDTIKTGVFTHKTELISSENETDVCWFLPIGFGSIFESSTGTITIENASPSTIAGEFAFTAIYHRTTEALDTLEMSGVFEAQRSN